MFPENFFYENDNWNQHTFFEHHHTAKSLVLTKIATNKTTEPTKATSSQLEKNKAELTIKLQSSLLKQFFLTLTQIF